jgi:hypothetical protein
MARPLQGTATNNSSSQTETQREGEHFAFSANSTAAGLFTGFNADEIDTAAKGFMSYTLLKKDENAIESGQNPDFNGSITNAQLFGFEKGNGKFTEIANAKDGPDPLGPNLSVGDIDSPPVDDSTAGVAETTVPSPTKTDQTLGTFSTKGFGVDILRNNPNADSPVTSGYLNRRDDETAGIKLGEYIDSTTYQYSNISLDTPAEE